MFPAQCSRSDIFLIRRLSVPYARPAVGQKPGFGSRRGIPRPRPGRLQHTGPRHQLRDRLIAPPPVSLIHKPLHLRRRNPRLPRRDSRPGAGRHRFSGFRRRPASIRLRFRPGFRRPGAVRRLSPGASFLPGHCGEAKPSRVPRFRFPDSGSSFRFRHSGLSRSRSSPQAVGWSEPLASGFLLSTTKANTNQSLLP